MKHPRRCTSPKGYVYDTAAQAEARFKGEDPGHQYSRFANPTVDMFERRMGVARRRQAARATATSMAAVTLSLVGQLKAGDHVVGSKAMFGSCRYVIEDYLPRFGVASTLVDGCNVVTRCLAQCGTAQHQNLLPRKSD